MIKVSLKRSVLIRGKIKLCPRYLSCLVLRPGRRSFRQWFLVVIFSQSCLSLFLTMSPIVIRLFVYSYFSARLQNLSICARDFCFHLSLSKDVKGADRIVYNNCSHGLQDNCNKYSGLIAPKFEQAAQYFPPKLKVQS